MTDWFIVLGLSFTLEHIPSGSPSSALPISTSTELLIESRGFIPAQTRDAKKTAGKFRYAFTGLHEN